MKERLLNSKIDDLCNEIVSGKLDEQTLSKSLESLMFLCWDAGYGDGVEDICEMHGIENGNI